MKGLALDGGGILGAGQSYILDQLWPINTSPPENTNFDFTVGTSIGALNAALYARGSRPDSFLGLFKKFAGDVFNRETYRPLSWFFGPKYDDDALNDVLRSVFKGNFGDVDIPLFIVTAQLDQQELKVFYSHDDDDARWPMWEVLRMAVAAETYFLPWKGHGDGGIFANNPSMIAVAGAVRRFGIPVSEVEICSIGTGRSLLNSSVGSTKYWTKIHWAIFLIDALLHGAANSMHTFFVERMPVKSYARFEFEREPEWKFDNPDIIPDILKTWKPQLDKAALDISKLFLK